MRKKIRICPVCNKSFETKYWNKKYCSQKCYTQQHLKYLREYIKNYKRKKIYKKKSKYPVLRCQYCGNRIQLHFDPRKEYYKLSKVRCYKCHKQPQGLEGLDK